MRTEMDIYILISPSEWQDYTMEQFSHMLEERSAL
jgi:hypothetical protein